MTMFGEVMTVWCANCKKHAKQRFWIKSDI